MSELRHVVAEAFASGGALSQAEPHYRPRGVQQTFAARVAEAIETRTVLVAEAGTGVGKTYAYLVPALLSGARVMVSTATKSLQDQLFLRDLPRLREALQVPTQLALLKGRASYLCRHRLEQARHSTNLPDLQAVRALARIEQWAQRTTSGDLAELDGLDERSPVIPIVTSTRENCLGTECAHYQSCHVMLARREAMRADLVVVNHHLFFADLALRDTGLAELLPLVDVAVFDEAHQLPEAGLQFLGTQLGSTQVIDFARDLLGAGLQAARGQAPWSELAARCEIAARELRLACAGGSGAGARVSARLAWQERAAMPDFRAALERLREAFTPVREALVAVADASPDFTRLADRAAQLAALAGAFEQEAEPARVRWIDLSPHGVRLVESPLEIREAMRAQIDGAPRAWIFTSATLGDDDRLSWFTRQAALEDEATLRLGSPFDYPRHARLYVPRDLPRPGDPAHGLRVAELAARCARRLAGRTFVLTTTLKALRTIGDALRDHLRSGGAGGEPIEVLVQGEAPKRALMQRFLAGPAAVLVGSQSFWEGIDVPGDALQCVLIDKLPFPPPNDPLVEARSRQIEAEGGQAFNDYFIAETAVSLKQGAGRLIRSETDRGLLVVCDPRMATMGYGRRLRAALPPMTAVASEEEALAWLDELAAPAGPAWDDVPPGAVAPVVPP
jgi:ATP-dependent DNA helicase DinG